MGTDYECGCRQSGGHWFLCKKHEHLLNAHVTEYTKASFVKEVYDKVMSYKLGTTSVTEIIDNEIWITSKCFCPNDMKELRDIMQEFGSDITISVHSYDIRVKIVIRIL